MRQRECNMKYQKSMCIKEGTVLGSHQLYLLFFFSSAGMEYLRVVFLFK